MNEPQLSSIHIDNDEEVPYLSQTSSFEQQRIQVCLEFQDVHFGVRQSKGLFNRKSINKEILKGVSGIVKPGQLLAIMGASGAGKTTLLNVLAGRMSSSGNYFASGSVRLNGEKREFSVFKKISAYVMQDDNMFAELTVEEQVTLSCLLRLPSSMSIEKKKQRVQEIIQEMGLSHVKNTMIGSETKRGVSGGERKRVSIATELVTNPSLLFLDEPTSGLDAFNARNVMQALLKLAQSGRTVITTIHQPRSDIFNMFDMLMLLSEGKVMYFGPAKDAVSYFTRIGYSCPEHYNPADFFLDTISRDGRSAEAEQESEKKIEYLWQCFEEQGKQFSLEPSEKELEKNDVQVYMKPSKSELNREKFANSYMFEFMLLAKRAFKLETREKASNIARIAQTLFFAVFLGLIWLNKGRNISYHDYDAIAGILFFLLINQSFISAFGTVFVLPLERTIVLRERASGMYRVSAYYLSKTLVELPRNALLCIVYILLLYWMVGLHATARDFFLSYVIVYLTILTAEGLASAVASSAPNPQVASAITPAFIVVSLLFGGFFLSSGQIPNYFIWLKYLSFFYYSYGSLLQVQFEDWRFYNGASCPADGVCTGSAVLQKLGPSLPLGGNIGLLITLLISFRVLTYGILRLRGPRFDQTL
ncbi:ABC transporter, ATP-binding protein isoform 2 [Galdieria sulphuraria]|uniref:Probable ATP-dependent transporter ycf16 n=1 Tax=Galdieria sulphuraria TaxID=130081 RepID=M2Y549_GALSU|nr:ABC transporter, ATP-binding protein isoform 2 [Galdieria sulphuraria]EME31098.1 ABC transporter, ATP-binding protein isoform 2 [Galdieria sulphuraria]|eukprot:XP_005707618.1 ABC transporter, ATP-binding protein isoform 2 [Galdieria sulphuraria]